MYYNLWEKSRNRSWNPGESEETKLLNDPKSGLT
jgi:hypothetical protein